MIDLHTHSLLSDGELVPSELARRAYVKGYKVIGISDHADLTNFERITQSILKITEGQYWGIKIVPGIELTHVPASMLKNVIERVRKEGICYVTVHGETITEPVEEGTNRAAIEAGCDILAHPGLINEEDVKLAAKMGVFLEISARKGHSLGNGRVAMLSKKYGAKLIFGSDAHSPSDLVDETLAKKIVVGAGLDEDDFYEMQKVAWEFVKEIERRKGR
ncbi:MAG: histidinol phosphate phosphatase domain-containing protein [Desulfobacterota bacterium]|nr:histidinol phosphate phosphatase domain-containing protein [Thermodesulfobacteriota bacterium]MDW8001893.1 histidinol phosphate phosphatase domain-containing protein [Deltaproteobacteria bacterium]